MLLLGSFLLELILPLCLAVAFLFEYLKVGGTKSEVGTAGLGMFGCFATALVSSYMVSMLIPVCILTTHGYFADAAPTVFWGKKIGTYVSCTFVIPGYRGVATLSKAVQLWWSEFLSLFA